MLATQRLEQGYTNPCRMHHPKLFPTFCVILSRLVSRQPASHNELIYLPLSLYFFAFPSPSFWGRVVVGM
ncbi:hypothetical protein BDQ94DRAFT_139950 [Aspergillus welwitschiae]|uniref:Uncharacterized protein n=1 Tax=Aspergillus welwitschiae TaxID=1341132 RepID=A0A3F3QA33_9EURO|nr:hypothetical protein BDQ94DRAFT_139950 [Aspergillus welwitschiae]RDH35626.1 hypothetical protein BDQ94DRAFT_139950 [Aspergillus welwitschiae]